MKIKILRTFRFPIYASHTLARPGLPPDQIEKFYSACGKKHGHSYLVEISFDLGYADFSADERLLAEQRFSKDSEKVRLLLRERLQGKDLNDSFPNTAGEALGPGILNLLRSELSEIKVCRLSLQETEKNRFETCLRKA